MFVCVCVFVWIYTYMYNVWILFLHIYFFSFAYIYIYNMYFSSFKWRRSSEFRSNNINNFNYLAISLFCLLKIPSIQDRWKKFPLHLVYTCIFFPLCFSLILTVRPFKVYFHVFPVLWLLSTCTNIATQFFLCNVVYFW